jgi:hypothetical protein
MDRHDHLTALLSRLKLTTLRGQLDSLIDQAGMSELTSREALTMFCEREVGEGRLEERLTHYAKRKLLIIDELGHFPFEPDAAPLFFQRVSRRYERGAMLVASNRTVGEWGQVFG